MRAWKEKELVSLEREEDVGRIKLSDRNVGFYITSIPAAFLFSSA